MDFEKMYHDALYALDRCRDENARLTDELAAARHRLELENQANGDLFSVIAEIAAMFDIPRSAPYISRETTSAVAQMQRGLAAARGQWAEFASMMEFDSHDCMCLTPPGIDDDGNPNDDDPDDPSMHGQYCPVYLQAYAKAMASGAKTPE